MCISRLRSSALCLLALGALALASACSDDSSSTPDTTPKQDGGTPDSNFPPPPDKVDCDAEKSDCKEMVLNQVIIPLTPADSIKYGYKKGTKVYNKLGDILSVVAADMPMQDTVDESINKGTLLLLMRLKAEDFTSGSIVGQAWKAQETVCCATPDEPAACATEAASTCFSGEHAFTADTSHTGTFSGTIASSKIDMLAPSYRLTLPLDDQTVLDIQLAQVQIRCTLTADGLVDGVLAGAISQSDVDTKLIPTIVAQINYAIENDLMEPSTKETVLNLLDTDNDGVISEAELRALVDTLLQPDLDVNGDGTNDSMSMGIGFAATNAVITVP